MSDVTAVVLSIGEPYTERALASVGRQTLPVAETVVVRGVSPFHCALNRGAAQVRTPFFLHVDADMVLDEGCLAALRPLMRDRVGLVQGRLRDPLCGRIAGIRLVRTECWAETPYADSIAPESLFTRDLAGNGWLFVEALRYEGANPRAWHSFGEHSPAYDLVYTLSKFRINGARYRHLGRADFLMKMTERVRRSDHPSALIALLGLTHGVFGLVGGSADALRPYTADAEHAFVERFLTRPATGEDCAAPLGLTAPPAGVFRTCYRRGAEIGRVGGADDLRAVVRSLDGTSADLRLAALLGLGHGFFHALRAADSLGPELAILAEFLPQITDSVTQWTQ